MAEDKKQDKIVLEREYVVPLRREWQKVPEYKRANKATKALKEFMVRHMKVYDRDLRKIKIDIYLNNEIRFRGMKKPLHKVKVKAIKYASGIVEVKLVQLPKHIEFEVARIARKEAEKLKEEKSKPEEKQAKTEEKKEEEKTEEKIEAKEKETSNKIAEEQIEKNQAQKMKHTAGIKKAPIIQRKALKR